MLSFNRRVLFVSHPGGRDSPVSLAGGAEQLKASSSQGTPTAYDLAQESGLPSNTAVQKCWALVLRASCWPCFRGWWVDSGPYHGDHGRIKIPSTLMTLKEPYCLQKAKECKLQSFTMDHPESLRYILCLQCSQGPHFRRRRHRGISGW